MFLNDLVDSFCYTQKIAGLKGLTMHVNVIMDGQLDEHLLSRQPAISITLYILHYILCCYLKANQV